MPEPGTIIEGKYEILGKIRESEAGAIYKVRHIHLDEIRILKVLRPQGAGSDELRRRFLQEAKTLILLKHPNICTIRDLFEDPQGTAYIVLEYIDGVNMSELLEASGPPPVSLALEIAHQTLLALECLHRRNIVHRDVEPGNIMLTMDENHEPQVKLVGFGGAKMITGTVELTSSADFVGKLKYSSPEQLGALAEGEKLDGRSDLYSLGVVLYQMLTGVLPIRGDQPRQILVGHLSLPPIPFAKSDPEGKVPQEVAEIVLKALEKRREKRFSSAEEFDEQVAALRNQFSEPEQSEITRPLTINEAWRSPSKTSAPATSDARKQSEQFSERTTHVLIPVSPLPESAPPVSDDPTLIVKQPVLGPLAEPPRRVEQPTPAPPVEPPASVKQPSFPLPSVMPPVKSPDVAPLVQRRRYGLFLILGTAAAGILLALLLLPKQQARPRPIAPAAPAAKPSPVPTAISRPARETPPGPGGPGSSVGEKPAPVSGPLRFAAEEARSRASAARLTAEKDEAQRRARNTYGRGRQKQEEAEGFFAREEYPRAQSAFAAAEELFLKAQATSAQWKRETRRSAKVRQRSSPNLTPAPPSVAPETSMRPEPEGEPLRIGGEVKAPVLINRVEPGYPEAARQIRMEGLVILEATITSTGAVEQVKVLKSASPLLDASAVRAVQQWRYKPATLNGRPVRVYLTVTVKFGSR